MQEIQVRFIEHCPSILKFVAWDLTMTNEKLHCLSSWDHLLEINNFFMRSLIMLNKKFPRHLK